MKVKQTENLFRKGDVWQKQFVHIVSSELLRSHTLMATYMALPQHLSTATNKMPSAQSMRKPTTPPSPTRFYQPPGSCPPFGAQQSLKTSLTLNTKRDHFCWPCLGREHCRLRYSHAFNTEDRQKHQDLRKAV